MTATLLFWAIAAMLALVCLAAIFAPMLRGRATALPRGRYDAQVFRDQLREIESDKTRGLMTEAEARATEIEVSRRLLATAEEDAAAGRLAPRRVSRLAGAGLLGLLLLASGGLYLRLGAPGVEDQPLVPRLERAAEERAKRPRQAEIEAEIAAQSSQAPAPGAPAGPRIDAAPGSAGAAMPPQDLALINQLKDVLKTRPQDERGHRLLARTLMGVGDWAGARVAQAQVIDILGDRATAEDYAEWAELMILATNGYVSPEAEAALGEALTRDPANKLARYYSGLTLLQGGRPDLTYRLWSGLLGEGPEDAPWIPTIRAQIGEVARMAGLPLPPGATAPAPPPGAPPGPNAADMEAAGQMSPGDRQSMIEGMVGQLATRLDTDGGTAAEWARLIRAQGVLGHVTEAQASWDKAKTAYAADPAALEALAAAAREAGLTAR
jgi:cytochrome c-type biogenesis protein CcmH